VLAAGMRRADGASKVGEVVMNRSALYREQEAE
jgi:hypothetical protein